MDKSVIAHMAGPPRSRNVSAGLITPGADTNAAGGSGDAAAAGFKG